MKAGTLRAVLFFAAALALLVGRQALGAFGFRLRLAFVLILTVLTISVGVRGAAGQHPFWTVGALVLLAPSLALAWRDLLRAPR